MVRRGEGARRGRAAWAHGEVREGAQREGGVGAAHGEERQVRVGERERTRGARARWLSEVRDGERERGRERESGGQAWVEYKEQY